MDLESPLMRGQHDSPVQGANSAPHKVGIDETLQSGVNKFIIYLSTSEQDGHLPDALTQCGLGGTQPASFEPGCQTVPRSATAVVTAQFPSKPLEKQESSSSSSCGCSVESTSPKKAEDEQGKGRVVRRPGKLQIKPRASWPVQEDSPKINSLLMRRRSSLPNGLLPLKIDCGSSTSMGSTSDTVTPPSEASRSLFDFYDLLPDVLGRGSFGTVRSGVRKQDGKKVAVKITSSMDAEMTAVAKQEFELLRSINHPFVVQALDIFYATTCTELVLDYFEGNTMEDAVKFSPRHSFLEGDCTLLFVKLLHALAYLHRMQVIHRDIKPQNILISEDLQDLRLLDFNSARRHALPTFDNWALSPTGTSMYAAPEVVAGQVPSASSDVWSAGLCWHFMLVGKLPQRRGLHGSYNNFRKEVTTASVTLTSSRWQCISEPCKSALRHCLGLDHFRRPTADELLKEEFFAAALEVTSQLFVGDHMMPHV